ncbi:MAG TPA: hypothetical protein VGJ97_00820 [Anaerolineaceae bacterium]
MPDLRDEVAEIDCAIHGHTRLAQLTTRSGPRGIFLFSRPRV